MHGRVSISVQAGEPYDTSTVNDDRNDPGDDSNFTATHGRVSIGVQAGEPYDTSTVSDDRNNPAELKDPNVGRYVSIGVDAGQPMEKRVPFSSYLQGASHITVNGGDFRTIYELPEEVERVPPPPRHSPKPISPSCQTLTGSIPLQWQESKNDKTPFYKLGRLQSTLRLVHKRKVSWPTEESNLSDLPPGEYLTTLLQPIADLFSQLHRPQVLKTPMECISVDFKFGESICGATFTAEDFNDESPPLVAPFIVSLPDKLFNTNGQVSSRVECILSKCLQYKPGVPFIIVTNFQDIAIFSPPTRRRPEAIYRKMLTTQPVLALRVISAAYLLDVLPRGVYINTPDPFPEIDPHIILPEGPPLDPNQHLLADEQIFATHHRHSDFDHATLVRDRARALQFFRWREQAQRRYPKVVAHANDTVTASTNEVGFILPPDVHPLYPFDASELPPDTTNHLTSIQRQSPLTRGGMGKILEQSKSFSLKIQNVLAEGTPRTMCIVYQCQITSIDDTPMSSPSLCLKLFDDRFQHLPSPDEYDEMDVPRLFDTFLIAEMYALNEALAYEKLRPVQGTVIPWFYGAHQFTLPDGMVLYGILMEYIEGFDIAPEFAWTLSIERQIDMIRSCRHAARVLDVADISQRDWHSGQILLHTNLKSKLDHAVLIDFASTTQTWEPDVLNMIENYFGILRILLDGKGNGFDTGIVWKRFGEPDDWDPVHAVVQGKNVQARDMFPYIT
ncbi:hypothetical protein M413DRAFT_433218 [Hebeloma cylindrosporum]|uniref:Protein kinase domain-containing protein n=1 Tax=Hebeloma cylindrosporum TaxID=76867 RepID=A0A0C3C545_HEBCY|nr:hypothetical protein M413DRAFT_433218 [Hebeloma cylindrosporum h7]